MNTWFVKEVSQAMNVSIRALHFYDKIGLLKPSGRLPNGYRVYSTEDVVKLKKIIALKFFGFTLAHIKDLLNRGETEMLAMLRTQFKLLHAKVIQIQKAQTSLLAEAIENLEKHKEVNWDAISRLVLAFEQTSDFKKSMDDDSDTLPPSPKPDYQSL